MKESIPHGAGASASEGIRFNRFYQLNLLSHLLGIHTGPVLAGNTGSENLLSYALIGETVNLAARIQDLTKQFRCDILISKETADLLDGSFNLKMESPAAVKGYSKPVTIYRVLG